MTKVDWNIVLLIHVVLRGPSVCGCYPGNSLFLGICQVFCRTSSKVSAMARMCDSVLFRFACSEINMIRLLRN